MLRLTSQLNLGDLRCSIDEAPQRRVAAKNQGEDPK